MATVNTTENKFTTGNTFTETALPAPACGSIQYRCALSSAAAAASTETQETGSFELHLTRNAVRIPLVPGSLSFTWSGHSYIDKEGQLYRDANQDGVGGVLAGEIDYEQGIARLNLYDGGDNSLTITSLAGRMGAQCVTEATFRTPGRPLRPGQVVIAGVTLSGQPVSAIANFDGEIAGDNVRGRVDYEKGIVQLEFGNMVDNSAELATEYWYDPEDVEEGRIWKPESVVADSLSYACVVYSYIPLDADLLGLNPVRLPSDGRVPIVKVGDVCVIHNTMVDELPASLTGGQKIMLSRQGIASVELYDSADIPRRVPSAMYHFDKDESSITIDSDNNDFSGWQMPLNCMHRIEDMLLVSDTQINGRVRFARRIRCDFPVEGTYISSALNFGDLQARVYGLFDQKTWKNVFSDDIDGDPATGTYNEINFPVVVTNAGAVSERWAIVFDSQDHFKVIGESRGVVSEGYITQDCKPVNPATNQPFFTIPYAGWGSGWAAGNMVRFNTDGACPPFWIVRTTLQGPAQEPGEEPYQYSGCLPG